MTKLEDMKFNLTPKMKKILLNFNSLVKKKYELLKLYDSTEDKSLFDEMIEIEKQKDKCKYEFISEFQKSNKKEIDEYLKLKELLDNK